MTWLCPDWNVKQILIAAEKYGYDGVEIRVESNHKHKIGLSTPKEERIAVRNSFADAGIEISCLATSLKFATIDKEKRKNNIDTLQKYIDLSADIGCPYIRIFGGSISVEPRGIISYMAEDLAIVANYACGSKVEILLETHDHFSHSLWVKEVIKNTNHLQVNALWDVMHPFRMLEDFSYTYANLKGHIRHLHIHDGIYNHDKTKIDMYLLGEGVINHRIPMRFLKKEGFSGHFSLEIIGKGEPDKWLEQYAKKFREYEKEIK